MADIKKLNGYNLKDLYARTIYDYLYNFEHASFGTEQAIGKIGNKVIYRKVIRNTSTHSSTYTIDSSLKTGNISDLLFLHGTHLVSGTWLGDVDQYAGGARYYVNAAITSSGVQVSIQNYNVSKSIVVAIYTK